MHQSEPSFRRRRLREGVGVVCVMVWLLGFLVAIPCPAAAQQLSVAETETLVRSIYFEGLPVDEARLIGADGAARLVEMLADPEESAGHGNILLALGLSGQPGAFAALRDWAATPHEGEIDRDTFRAWQALPFALGHLAKHDPRAVARLEAQLNASPPSWSFRHFKGARLYRMNRRAAARALGDTGLPAARAALDRADRQATDPEFTEDLRQARDENARRARGVAR